MDTHRVSIEVDDDNDRYSWECDCGIAGSGSGGFLNADNNSDKHIPPGSTRIDTYWI